jgi:hypothetical protein
MEAIPANFLWQHKSHVTWWFFIKMKQDATLNYTMRAPKDKEDEPNKLFLLELLKISMKEL